MGHAGISDLSSSRHMYIHGQVENKNLTALVDTGASGFAFVSRSLCNRLNLKPQPLPSSIALVGFEGKQGPCISRKTSLRLTLSNHVEIITAYVVEVCKYELVLGLPWLEKHKPYVDWEANTITFGEPCLAAGCCRFETTIPYTNSRAYQKYTTNPRKTASNAINDKNSSPKFSKPIQVSASIFDAISSHPGSQFFALSLRDIDLVLDESMQRLATVHIGNEISTIPKNADPKTYLPLQYHEFLDVFDRNQANDLPPHRPWDHPIDLQHGKQPPASRPYSMNHHELKALRKYLDTELSKGFIRVSRSPAAAPVLFVKKPNGDLRFCIDYRGLNAISVKNRHSLPLISETLSQLSKAKYYTKLDIISAFNKLRIKEGDEWKAAFTCRYGLFEPLVLPFGLSNGPASFQSYINHALRGYLDNFCTAYMDDILIYSQNLSEHQDHVKSVLQRLREHGLQVDISKCSFEATQVTYLGLIVSTKGISMDPKKVACVQEWPTPQSLRDIQGFLGFANFYRRFIPEFSRLAAPLVQLTKKNVPFKWDDKCESSFFQIKNAFKDGSMLAHFDPQLQTVLETDASDFVTAAILSQYDSTGILRPVAFMSKKMLPAECNYDIYDKELLAIVNSFENWTAELGSVEAPTLILTDHKNLEYFTSTKKLNRRQARWSELLADYDFKIVFRPGKSGGKPDALTRISADKPSTSEDERNTQQFQTLLKPHQILRNLETTPNHTTSNSELTSPSELSPENWIKSCNDDNYCQSIRAAIINKSAKRKDIQLASCKLTPYSFSLDDKEYVPESCRELILQHLHENPLYGHRGAAALYSLLSRRYWWPNCNSDSKKYARGCEACQRNNPSTQKPFGFLSPLSPPKSSFRHLTLDYIGPLPTCSIRNFAYRYILQVIDRLTKRAWIIPIERPTAKETAEAFLSHVVRFAGLPDSLVSDQGRSFIDKTWKEICCCLKITHKLSTSYHPETDGQTERTNKTLEVYLRHYVNYHQDDWVKHLSLAEFCYNNSTNSSTGTTPFFASFGHHPRLDFRPESDSPAPRDLPEFIVRMSKIVQNCNEQILLSQSYQSSYANESRLPAPRYEPGDLVYLSLKNIKLLRPTKKLDHIRAGPWKIIAMKTPLVAKLDLPPQLKIDNNFHVNLLRPAHIGFPSQIQKCPPPLEPDTLESDIYEVEAILDSRIKRNKIQFLVRWTGYNETSWEPYEHLDGCKELVSEFYQAYPKAPGSQELASGKEGG